MLQEASKYNDLEDLYTETHFYSHLGDKPIQPTNSGSNNQIWTYIAHEL